MSNEKPITAEEIKVIAEIINKARDKYGNNMTIMNGMIFHSYALEAAAEYATLRNQEQEAKYRELVVAFKKIADKCLEMAGLVPSPPKQ